MCSLLDYLIEKTRAVSLSFRPQDLLLSSPYLIFVLAVRGRSGLEQHDQVGLRSLSLGVGWEMWLFSHLILCKPTRLQTVNYTRVKSHHGPSGRTWEHRDIYPRQAILLRGVSVAGIHPIWMRGYHMDDHPGHVNMVVIFSPKCIFWERVTGRIIIYCGSKCYSKRALCYSSDSYTEVS